MAPPTSAVCGQFWHCITTVDLGLESWTCGRAALSIKRQTWCLFYDGLFNMHYAVIRWLHVRTMLISIEKGNNVNRTRNESHCIKFSLHRWPKLWCQLLFCMASDWNRHETGLHSKLGACYQESNTQPCRFIKLKSVWRFRQGGQFAFGSSVTCSNASQALRYPATHQKYCSPPASSRRHKLFNFSAWTVIHKIDAEILFDTYSLSRSVRLETITKKEKQQMPAGMAVSKG